MDILEKLKLLGLNNVSLIIADRLFDGFHLVKLIALEANAIYIGKPLVIALLVNGGKGVINYLESIKVETQLLVSALGKYDIKEV